MIDRCEFRRLRARTLGPVALGVVLGAAFTVSPAPLSNLPHALAQETEVAGPQPAPPPAPVDSRDQDEKYRQARQLLRSIDGILEDAATNRTEARRLPSRDDYIVPPIWTETREDREADIKTLMDAALGVVTDVPIVDMQKAVDGRRKNIRNLELQIAELREKKLSAPTDSLLPGIFTDTVSSLAQEIADLEKRIEGNQTEIVKTKGEIHQALGASGIQMSTDEVDLILDSVLSGDLVRLVATFNAAKLIDAQLGQLVQASDNNPEAARKYFAMHAALFAMLVHAQDTLIKKIDTKYMPRLINIEADIARTAKETARLLKQNNRADQKRALEANLKSQAFARRVAQYYRGYLLQQREQLARARMRSVRDLRIADNTFETVEASFQLRELIKDAATSFEAIQKLEAPGFDQIFKDQELRREFESLTRKLDVPSS